MTIEELAKRKMELQSYLRASEYVNVAGASLDDLTQHELRRIEWRKELNAVERSIREYEEN